MGIDFCEAFISLKKDDILTEVKYRIDKGDDVLDIVEDCRQGMSAVGDRFQSGESFLAELILSGEIFKAVLEVLKPFMSNSDSANSKGIVIMATLKGDIHDLGKGIVVTLLKAHNFTVYDLGVDLDPKILINKIKELKPDFVGFSALLTPNLHMMKKAVDLLQSEGLRDSLKIMIGGGITTSQTREFVGADFQATDATAGVSYCLDTIGGN